jgi:hypothetical protein
MNFPQTRISGVGKSYAQRGEIAVRMSVQRSNEQECGKFEKLPMRLADFLYRHLWRFMVISPVFVWTQSECRSRAAVGSSRDSEEC